MPPTTPSTDTQHGRQMAKLRVVRVLREDGDWRLAAIHNDVPYSTARRAILSDGTEPKKRGGVRPSRVKMTVAVMAKLEELVDEDCRMTCIDMRDRLHSELGVSVSRTSVHRALQGMLFSVKQLRVEKSTINSSTSKAKRKTFVEKLNMHAERGDMIVFQDETNFNLYLSRKQGWSRVGDRAKVALPLSQGKNLHVQGGVSSGTGVVLLRTHEGSIDMFENAQFIADLFVSAIRTEEYKQLDPSSKVVVVTDNAPAHSRVENLVRQKLTSDGIMNASKLVVLRLAPYSPMLNPIEGCWSVLKSHMRRFMAEKKEEMLVRGSYDTFTEHRLALMKEAVAVSAPMITQRLVQNMEHHCMRARVCAERGEDMQLGK